MLDVGRDMGHTLDSATVEQGLRELSPNLHFDVGNRSGAVRFTLESPTDVRRKINGTRMSVYYNEQYITGMDRGVIPEFKSWSVQPRQVEVDFGEADMPDASVKYEVVHPFAPGYADLYHDAALGRRENYVVRGDGNLIRIMVMRPRKVRGRVLRLGWRHTFERLIMANIPGITREAVAAKFNVDMLRFINGPPTETYDQIWREE